MSRIHVALNATDLEAAILGVVRAGRYSLAPFAQSPKLEEPA